MREGFIKLLLLGLPQVERPTVDGSRLGFLPNIGDDVFEVKPTGSLAEAVDISTGDFVFEPHSPLQFRDIIASKYLANVQSYVDHAVNAFPFNKTSDRVDLPNTIYYNYYFEFVSSQESVGRSNAIKITVPIVEPIASPGYSATKGLHS